MSGFPTLPYTQVQGELVFCPEDFLDQSCPPADMQAEIAAAIEANVFTDQQLAGVYGWYLRPVARRYTAEYVPKLVRPRLSLGHWMLDGGLVSAWGPMLRAVMPVGCDTTAGLIRDGDFKGVTDSGTRLAESAELEPHHQLDGSVYGSTLIFHGFGRCFNFQDFVNINGVNIPLYRQDVYITDVFGLQCAFCPTMFMTVERPCFGCSFEDHGETVLTNAVDRNCPGSQPHNSSFFDSCNDQTVNVGEAVCIPDRAFGDPNFDPNWHMECELDNAGNTLEHHCEECVYQRNLGFLVNLILEGTNALSRIPMRPIRSRTEICPYECGAFGWTLWSRGTPFGDEGGTGLRIPDVFDSPPARIVERPCSNVLCIGDDAWHESGHPLCGTGFNCLCTTNEGTQFCEGTHFFSWKGDSSENQIEVAHVCFKQRELCDPANGPCDSNPFDFDDFRNPSTEMIVDVDVRIRIKLVFDHFGPFAGSVGCGCCLLFGSDVEPAKITVILEGQWCGPIPFGNRDTFLGYMPFGERIYPGRQNPVTGNQIISPDGTFPRGSCANLFVDQGLYSDFEFDEPPKRCPSWEGDSGAGGASTQFWCPPKLNWKWSMSGGGTHWQSSDPTKGANKHEMTKQCWGAQLLKGSCPGGSIWFDQFDLRGCDDPNCRRGCSVTEDLDDGPCDGSNPRSTPWGCSQCQV